jgi:sugar lactone lactonase YvrE
VCAMIETVPGLHATIGESPTWVAQEKALYWIDVKAPALQPLSSRRRIGTSLAGSERDRRIRFDRDGGAVVALRQGLFRLELDSGALHLLAEPPFDPAPFRFNEGARDANGRF